MGPTVQYPHYNRADTLGLHLVRTPPSEIPHTCDIVILHGLNGGAAKSFRHSEGGQIWFADFLPLDIVDPDSWTNARIWAYGYDADTAFGSNSSDALDFARTLLYKVSRIREGYEHHKIIWVCHSLGGIVVKTALVEARFVDTYQPILTQTAGIVFLGTPHSGSNVASVAEIGATIASAVLPDAIMPKNRALIRSLKRDSKRLFETAGRFANICSSMKIYSMYESLPTYGGVMVVERHSAVMNIGSIEKQIMLDGTNHRTMCRFRDPADQNYLAVLEAIKDLTKSTSTLFDPPDLSSFRLTPDPSAWDRRPQHSSPEFVPNGLNHLNYEASRSQASFASTVSSTFTAPSIKSQRSVSSGPGYVSTGPRPPAKEPIRPEWQPPREETSRGYEPSPYDAQGHPAYPGMQQRPNPPYPRSRSNSGSTTTTANSLYNRPLYNDSTPTTADMPVPKYTPYRPNEQTPTSPPTNRTPVSKPAELPTQTFRNSSPTTPRSPPVKKPSLPAPTSAHWTCDDCREPIQPFESRIHCLDCEDYDQCGDCHSEGKASKAHKPSHRIEMILKARQFTQEQNELIIPGESVHPDQYPGRKFKNWTVRDERRIHHLSCHADHARYLVDTVEPGNYRVSFRVETFVVPEFKSEHIQQLGSEPLGKLRVAVGKIKSKQGFFRNTFSEDLNLIGKLFETGWYSDFAVRPRNGPSIFDLKCILSIEGIHARDDIGILFQWWDFKKFQSSDKALISLSLLEAKFEEPLEYDTTFGGADDMANKISPYREPPSQEAETANDGPTLTLAQLVQAIVEVQEEERDRQEKEAFLQALAEELARRKQAEIEIQEREAAAQLLTNYMIASQAGAEFALLAEYLKSLGI